MKDGDDAARCERAPEYPPLLPDSSIPELSRPMSGANREDWKLRMIEAFIGRDPFEWGTGYLPPPSYVPPDQGVVESFYVRLKSDDDAVAVAVSLGEISSILISTRNRFRGDKARLAESDVARARRMIDVLAWMTRARAAENTRGEES